MATVLIVDDNAELAQNLGEVLELDGVRVRLAHSGEEAMRVLEADEFQGVVTDVRMPGCDGVALLRYVKHRKPQVPVVIITAYAHERTLEDAVRAGASTVLAKPLDIDRFRTTVATLMIN